MPNVPDRSWYDPVLNAHLHTGSNAQDKAIDLGGMPPRRVAMDIETPGLDRAFEINCVTAAWYEGDQVHSVLLDPLRRPADKMAVHNIVHKSASLVFHNAPFDVPALYHHGLITAETINRIADTLVLARMAIPDVTQRRDLSTLAVEYLGMSDFSGGMSKAFKAAGYGKTADGYEGMDIDSPIYRQGAMADTVATLRLEPVMRQKCRDWLTDHPFKDHGASNDSEADYLIGVQETVNRVMLRRTARGLAVDRDYLDKYIERVHEEQLIHTSVLAQHDLEGGTGKGGKVIEYLSSIGELPSDWPRTPTGKLSASKEHLAELDHPLVVAQRRLAEIEKVTGYLTKVHRQSTVTGRCHPQVAVLGASATGRMSYSSPELQQFSADARPILCDDGQGLTSIDWSQIEPVTMGLLAKDAKFLDPYERGEDLYEPLMRAAGVDRKLAKVVLLASMYGQGDAAMAGRIGQSQTRAAQIRRQINSAMPRCAAWMTGQQDWAEKAGSVITAGGRMLPVDSKGAFRAVNYVVQGSAYDVLAYSIVEMERRGIGDSLHLAMHDEVVVDTPVADEVREIMQTPPDFLINAAGRTPVLRTDRADMGHAWAKV